jgi:hypothetical protein
MKEAAIMAVVADREDKRRKIRIMFGVPSKLYLKKSTTRTVNNFC